MAAKQAKSIPKKIGKYAITEKIAEGAMGSVYKGLHPDTSENVAIKVIAQDLAGDDVFISRFEQEYEISRGINHPGMVRALDYGVDGEHRFLVMEFINGRTLGKRIEEKGKLPPDEAVRYICQIGEALHLAHERGIIHRDVKPDNILVSEEGQAKLTDLGIAKNTEQDQGLTTAGIALGTPHFMAPEQLVDAKNVDLRCDVYGLGATLYMAITGDLPFGQKTYLGLFKTKAASDLTPPRDIVKNLDKKIDAAIRRAMAAEPGQRFASIADFVEALSGKKLKAAAEAPAAGVSKTVAASPAAVPTEVAKSGKAGKPGAERRVTVRYPSKLEGMCRPIGAEDGPRWLGNFIDISAGGICMVLRRRFEPGTILTVELPGAGQERPERLLVKVMRVQKESARKWILGCQFAGKIDDGEVQALR